MARSVPDCLPRQSAMQKTVERIEMRVGKGTHWYHVRIKRMLTNFIFFCKIREFVYDIKSKGLEFSFHGYHYVDIPGMQSTS